MGGRVFGILPEATLPLYSGSVQRTVAKEEQPPTAILSRTKTTTCLIKGRKG